MEGLIMGKTKSRNRLTHLEYECNMELSDIAKLHEFMTKKSKLNEVIDLNKIKTRPDGRCYIYINRKQIISSNYEALIDNLYESFFGISVITLKEFYPMWMIWRRDETHISDATLKRDSSTWNTMLKNTDIVNLPINSLKAKDFICFFRAITKDGNITKKRFYSLRSILNGMYYRAVELEIVDHNPLRDINYGLFNYKPINDSDNVYTLEEKAQLHNYLSNQNDIYSLGIMLQFQLLARIGELKSLKWSDVKGNKIRINTQIVESQLMNDDLSFDPRQHSEVSHIKGNTSHGFRDVSLTPSAMTLLDRIKQINKDGEYILMAEGKPLTTVTYNRRLKAACETIGIPYRSSHAVRFTSASILNQNGIGLPKLQKILGHSTLAMTMHYLRNVSRSDEDYEKMVKALN